MNDNRRARLIISGIVLAIFWSAILSDYWPSLAPAALRLINTTRAAGAPTMESTHFKVSNNSMASEAQVQEMIRALDKQYAAITRYTRATAPDQLPVLIVNGLGPAVIDGPQIMVNFDNGQIDTSLVPFFLVFLIEEIPINPAGEIAAPGGHALQVVEATGLGDELIRQPLNAWTLLLRQSHAYMPLEEAWKVEAPNDEESLYNLLRAMLESGSFMRWFTAKYGLDTAQRVARGETIENATGKSLAENEAEWLKWLDRQKVHPKPCEEVVPADRFIFIICKELAEAPQ